MKEGKEPPPLPIPSPGSNEAIKIGCSCPVLDNNHGKGYMGVENIYVYNVHCPVHKNPTTKTLDDC